MLWYIDYVASLRLGMLRIYDSLDVDGNGKLDRIEFPSQARGVFNLLDSNKDGYITAEEIEHMIQRLEARGTQTNINNEEPVGSEEGKTPSRTQTNINNEEPVGSEEGKTPSSFDDRLGDNSESDDNNF